MAIDQQKLDQFLGNAVNDLGAAISALLLHIGDKPATPFNLVLDVRP